jgi:membrane-bound lytic murein transglycosylase D
MVLRKSPGLASLTNIFAVGLSAGMVLLSGCGGKQPNKTPLPVAQAMAPAIQSAVEPAPVKPVPVRLAHTSSKSETSSPKQTAQEQEHQASPADPVEATIAEAEKAYNSGEANYKAGHLDAAKQDFNHAVDILMQGPVDIRDDDRLQQEFDKITDEINQMEMTAFKEGDGFTEQQAEPAPIDEANQSNLPADPNLKAKAEQELKTVQSDLPLVINDYVAGYINYFSTKGRATFENSVARAGKYRDMILRIFREEGLPQDLIYLAQAESGFKPLALSKARARGMWQFMASRGVGYGLHRNWWVDDRQDPEKATRAAARHLKDLYSEFGDWYLAMAAYNSGPGNVQQAVKRTGYADFWELYKRNVLPAETKNYVPIILAMTIMSKNPAQYGLDSVKPEAPVQYDVVRVNYPVDLRLVAECVDATAEQLIELNPSLLRRTTPKDEPFDLHLPPGTKEKYETAIAAIPQDKRVIWRYHKVAQGDTLAGIARKYHTTQHAIEEVNNLQTAELTPDTKLVIPISGSSAGLGKIVYSRYPSRYRVHSGDTVLSVAEDFGVAPERLRRWNRLKGNSLRRGRVLVVYKPLAPGEGDKAPRRRRHTAHKSTTAKPGRATAQIASEEVSTASR